VHQRDITLGPPAAAIMRAAEANEADEIFIGSRGLGRVRALLGSVAHDVIHRANCPVTVIPERMVELRTETPAAVATAV
jgi:nucleotide-binding universal stress UspA family protein